MGLFRRTPEQRAAKEERRRQKEEAAADKQRRWEADQAARRLHQERLVKAAGVSSANLVCHRDTWAFLESECHFVGQFQLPPPGEGSLIKVPLSGPNLVRALTNMKALRDTPGRYVGDRAVATRVYNAVAEIVDGVDPSAKSGTPVPDVVLDDKIGTVEAVREDDARD
ncbi:hypothetical protein AB0F17_59845 [Nonomuraea sp. NPDC026600]|uniref:hypothetical protein n=1 Tax=Nonomuraea sp. NPDC026600 TaxID=3155363 RepID=UPI0033E068B7